MKSAKIRLMKQISGIIDQSPMLINELTVFENIALPLQLIGFNKEMINKSCLEIMALFGINYLRSKTASDISLAEARLVTIARALVKEPQVILADDPTSGLDESTTLSLFDTLSKASEKGATVIIASSDKMLRTYFSNAVSAEIINGKVTIL
jgi:ABC-type ATPase involved in cell division